MGTRPIAIVGSLNVDYIARVQTLPRPGETVPASEVIQRFGGKGANQAVAVARQGARARMIGCVGNDPEGTAYLDRLRAFGIESQGIDVSNQALTGTAWIAVDRRGENMILVCAGANASLTPSLIRHHRKQIESAGMVLLQFEVPLPAVLESIRIANHADVPIVLNPSPWRTGFPWGKYPLDSVILNETEAGRIFGFAWQQGNTLRKRMKLWRIGCVIVTRGHRSTILATSSSHQEIPALPIQPVDTVGAGDAFAGTYVTRCVEGADRTTAIQYANCAGGLATLKKGAQEAIPSRVATDRAYRRYRDLH